MIALITAIASFLSGLMGFFQKYLPAKTSEEKVEDGAAQIDEEIKKMNETGRP